MKILEVKTRQQFYKWLIENSEVEAECFVHVKKGNPDNADGVLSYLDAVECALCFGWIDSQTKNIDGRFIQRFSPRKKMSSWTELNKERCRRLIRLGEMTEAGFKCCPDLNANYKYPTRIISALNENEDAYNFFMSCPVLYRNIRIYNVEFYYSKNETLYKKALQNLIDNCAKHKMYGEWNDYGRLL